MLDKHPNECIAGCGSLTVAHGGICMACRNKNQPTDEQLAWEIRKIINRPIDPKDDPNYDAEFLPWDEWDREDQVTALADLAKIRKLLSQRPADLSGPIVTESNVYVYAKNPTEAEHRAKGGDNYEPWDDHQKAVRDGSNPNCVSPGEQLYNVRTVDIVRPLMVYATVK